MPNQKFDSPVPSDAVRHRLAESLPERDKIALEVAFALRGSVQKIDAALGRFLSDDALTPGRWQVLVVLWSHEGPVPQSDIVKSLEVSRATISGLVEVLRVDGHVKTTVSAADHRQVYVDLTDAARAMTGRLIKKNASRLRDEFHLLNDADLRQMLSTLRKAAL